MLALGAYFGVGAYYNYSTFGATGLDLIPYVLLSLASAIRSTSAGTETFGERCLTCFGTSLHTYARASAHDQQAEAAMLQYESCVPFLLPSYMSYIR
jgi:hypothetical protein